MEFEYSNKWHGISKVNIKAGDTWEYLGISNKYLNSIFNKIDDGKKDENGYREVSQEELSLLEKLLQKAKEITGNNSNRFFDEDFQEIERQLDEGEIELPNGIRNTKPDDDERPYKEHVTHHYHLTTQDYEDIKNNKTDIETIRQKYIDKIKDDLKKYNQYDERFPEGRYEVEVIFNGGYYESFVYDIEFEAYKKSDPQKLKRAIDDFMNGDFDAINTIENPVEFLEAYRKKSGGKTMFSDMMSQYKDGKISSEQIQNYMRTLEKKFEDYENEFNTSNPDSKFKSASSFWYGSYWDLSSRVSDYFSQEKQIQYKYENNEIDKEQVLELQKFIKDNFNVEVKEYIVARIMEQGTLSDYNIYEYDFEELKNHYKNLDEERVEYCARWDLPYSDDDVNKNEIKELQKLFKDEYDKDISETDAAYMIKSYRRQFKKGYNLEKLKQDLLNGKVFKENGNVKDFNEYLDNRVLGGHFVENDTLETLEMAAQATEQEYGRYNFDIYKSPIADLARQSNKIRNKAEKELKVTKTNDKIVLYNKSTREERIIDLNKLTSKLDDKHKQIILNALNGFNNLSLWEFAVESANSLDTNISEEFKKYALAEYSIENDNININTDTEEEVSSYTLLHEMCHAIMSTIIDGKNTPREPLFREFTEAFEEEQKAHIEKRLRNGAADGGNYTYCAQNIHEFAAEAGCLWLSGKSNSEFTIATHFPKSYRLFVQLIEKIRAQETGRSTGEQA